MTKLSNQASGPQTIASEDVNYIKSQKNPLERYTAFIELLFEKKLHIEFYQSIGVNKRIIQFLRDRGVMYQVDNGGMCFNDKYIHGKSSDQVLNDIITLAHDFDVKVKAFNREVSRQRIYDVILSVPGLKKKVKSFVVSNKTRHISEIFSALMMLKSRSMLTMSDVINIVRSNVTMIQTDVIVQALRETKLILKVDTHNNIFKFNNAFTNVKKIHAAYIVYYVFSKMKNKSTTVSEQINVQDMTSINDAFMTTEKRLRNKLKDKIAKFLFNLMIAFKNDKFDNITSVMKKSELYYFDLIEALVNVKLTERATPNSTSVLSNKFSELVNNGEFKHIREYEDIKQTTVFKEVCNAFVSVRDRKIKERLNEHEESFNDESSKAIKASPEPVKTVIVEAVSVSNPYDDFILRYEALAKRRGLTGEALEKYIEDKLLKTDNE